MGYVQSMERVTMDNPRLTAGGIPYFTAGQRLVAWLSEEPVALDETVFLFNTGLGHVSGKKL